MEEIRASMAVLLNQGWVHRSPWTSKWIKKKKQTVLASSSIYYFISNEGWAYSCSEARKRGPWWT